MSALALVLSGLVLAAAPGPTVDTDGPGTVCFRYSSFSLADGERVDEAIMGVHGVLLTISSPGGRYEVGENEILKPPLRLGRRVLRTETASVYRSFEPVRYAVMARPEFSPDQDVMLLVLTGEAFDGTGADARIYSRVNVGDPTSIHCDQDFRYGWDVVLGLD